MFKVVTFLFLIVKSQVSFSQGGPVLLEWMLTTPLQEINTGLSYACMAPENKFENESKLDVSKCLNDICGDYKKLPTPYSTYDNLATNTPSNSFFGLYDLTMDLVSKSEELYNAEFDFKDSYYNQALAKAKKLPSNYQISPDFTGSLNLNYAYSLIFKSLKDGSDAISFKTDKAGKLLIDVDKKKINEIAPDLLKGKKNKLIHLIKSIEGSSYFQEMILLMSYPLSVVYPGNVEDSLKDRVLDILTKLKNKKNKSFQSLETRQEVDHLKKILALDSFESVNIKEALSKILYLQLSLELHNKVGSKGLIDYHKKFSKKNTIKKINEAKKLYQDLRTKNKMNPVFANCHRSLVNYLITEVSEDEKNNFKKLRAKVNKTITNKLFIFLSTSSRTLLKNKLNNINIIYPKTMKEELQNIKNKQNLLSRSRKSSSLDAEENFEHYLLNLQLLDILGEDVLVEFDDLCSGDDFKLVSDHSISILEKGISLSWYSLKKPNIGEGIYAHEVGHQIKTLYQENELSDESSDLFLASLQCVEDNRFEQNSVKVDSSSLFIDEDFADLIATQVRKHHGTENGNESENFLCPLVHDNGSSEYDINSDNNYSLKTNGDLDEHSPTLYRIIQNELGQGNTVSDSCPMKHQDLNKCWYFSN
jgi:hypothetical protein